MLFESIVLYLSNVHFPKLSNIFILKLNAFTELTVCNAYQIAQPSIVYSVQCKQSVLHDIIYFVECPNSHIQHPYSVECGCVMIFCLVHMLKQRHFMAKKLLNYKWIIEIDNGNYAWDEQKNE